MSKRVIATALAAICGVGATDAHAKAKYQCKPAMTGFGKDEFAHKAKWKAIADYKAKAAAAYGQVVWNINISDSCTKQRGNGWTCWHKSRPCVDGGLKPSISRTPHIDPPRLRIVPKSRGRGFFRPKGRSPASGAPRHRSPRLLGGFRLIR